MALSLAAFQDRFAQALIAAEPPADPDVDALTAQPGFAVYRNTVLSGCIDALEANFPTAARLVGSEWFRAAALVYVREHLPAQPMLADYGASFPEFLRAFAPADELPYLPDIARLDRHWTEAHAARDEAALDADAIAAILGAADLASRPLRPHASARWLLSASLPIFTIFARNRAAGPIDATPFDWCGEGILIVRPRNTVHWQPLDPAGRAFFDACAQDLPLATALERALACAPGATPLQILLPLADAGALVACAAPQSRSSAGSTTGNPA